MILNITWPEQSQRSSLSKRMGDHLPTAGDPGEEEEKAEASFASDEIREKWRRQSTALQRVTLSKGQQCDP